MAPDQGLVATKRPIAHSINPANAVTAAMSIKKASGAISSHAVPRIPDSRLPANAAKNHAAMVVARKREGASSANRLRPIGRTYSSASVKQREEGDDPAYVGQSVPRRVVVNNNCEHDPTTKPKSERRWPCGISNPSGPRRKFRRCQKMSSNGVKMKTNIGLSDCSQVASTSQSPICRSTLASTQTASVFPVCSYAVR